jgi:hypothetical protein
LRFSSPFLIVKAPFHFLVAMIGFADAAVWSAQAPILWLAH